MSYIGVPPQATFSSGLLDRFTSTTGTTVTLTHDIASENDIVVFVNFVKQDSTTYSVGGTGNKTLTLGGTLVSSDIVEVHYLNIVGQTNAPSAGSVGSSQLTADVITGQTALAVAPDSTDELLISDGGTLKRIDVSLVGGANTPAFRVYRDSSAQTISTGTNVKIQFNAETYDTANAFDSTTNYRFTPQTAGKYFIHFQYGHNSGTGHSQIIPKLYKNGSYVARSNYYHNAGTYHYSVSTTISLNGSSDYVEAFVYHNYGSDRSSDYATGNVFLEGFRIIE